MLNFIRKLLRRKSFVELLNEEIEEVKKDMKAISGLNPILTGVQMITLESIKEAVSKITPYPWIIERGKKSEETFVSAKKGGRILRIWNGRSAQEANALFIASAPEYIKWLIDKLEHQQQQVDIICDREDQEWLSKVEQVTKLEADLAKEKERVKSLEKELTDFKATFLGEGIEPVKWESKL